MLVNGVEIPIPLLQERCRSMGITRVWLFGSILTDRFSTESDVDLLIETDPTMRPGLFALGGLADELSRAIGRQVHLTLLGGIASAQRNELLRSTRLVHAA